MLKNCQVYLHRLHQYYTYLQDVVKYFQFLPWQGIGQHLYVIYIGVHDKVQNVLFVVGISSKVKYGSFHTYIQHNDLQLRDPKANGIAACFIAIVGVTQRSG